MTVKGPQNNNPSSLCGTHLTQRVILPLADLGAELFLFTMTTENDLSLSGATYMRIPANAILISHESPFTSEMGLKPWRSAVYACKRSRKKTSYMPIQMKEKAVAEPVGTG
jgi:hypothetical protein